MASTDRPEPPGLLLRPATPDDAAGVTATYLAARRAAPMPPSMHDDAEVARWLGSRLADDSGDEVWVAEADGVVAGYARLRDAWLDDLYVHPVRAGEGIGTALLDLAKGRRPDGFCLWVFADNVPARRFYAGRGLVELEATDGSANEERAPDVRLAWPGRDPLGFLRALIDDVDAELGDVLARRAALTAAVQRFKRAPGRDPERERAVAEALALRAPHLGVERLTRIVHTIITESLDAADHE